MEVIQADPLVSLKILETGIDGVYSRLYQFEYSKAGIGHYFDLLSPEEQHKSKSYLQTKTRVRFILTRAFVRLFVSEVTGMSPRQLIFSKNEYGKPYIVGSKFDVSISHSEEFLLLTLSEKGSIGCDIENTKNPLMSDITDIVTSVMTSDEFEMLNTLNAKRKYDYAIDVWVKKEAWLKAIGLGFMADPKTYCTENSHTLDCAPSYFHAFRLKTSGQKYESAIAICHIES